MIKSKIKEFLKKVILKIIKKEFVKKIFLKIIKIVPKVYQVYPLETSRSNTIFINDIGIVYEPLSELTARRWKEFERTGKEKNTIDWINSFIENKVFFDIGANVGVFSIYSALKRKSKVYSFEPEPNSFIELFRVAEANNCDVTPMLIPLSNDNNANFFNLKNHFVPGKSGHKFGNRIENKKSFGISSYKLDDLVLSKTIPMPNYIKIDVDGHEKRALEGMKEVLQNDKLISILVEFSYSEELDYYEKEFKKYNLKLIAGPTGNNRNYIFSKKINI